MKPVLILIACLGLVFCTGCATCDARKSVPRPKALFPDGARILFQGDSITDGNRGRTPDPNHVLGHGYQALIASRFGADFPGQQLTFLNRGISGNKVSDLAQRWQQDAIDLRPDYLSILVGINDLNAGVSAVEFEQQYDRLLAATTKALPAVKLILGEPFGLPVGPKKSSWASFRVDLEERQAVVARLGRKYHATVVPFQKMFDEATRHAGAEYWIWDGIHPTYAGHQLMADAWVRAVTGAPAK